MLSPVRPSSSGLWHVDDAGRGALLFDPALVGTPAARERLIAAVLGVRAANIGGLVGTADLVEDGTNLWLLTDKPINPCLADLLEARDARTDAICAVAILTDIAATLSQLHLGSVSHGGLAPDSVIIDTRGRALLAETAIATALSGRTPAAADDIVAWATIARTLGPIWSRHNAPLWREIVMSATIAEATGLAAATARLQASTPEPELAAARQRLAEAAARPGQALDGLAPAPISVPNEADADGAARAVATAVGLGAAASGGRRDKASTQGVAQIRIGGAAVTQLGRNVSGLPRQAPPPGADARGPEQIAGLRFGPGVPVAVPTLPPTTGSANPRRPARGRGRRFRSAVLTLAVIAAVAGWLWWRNGVALSVHQVAVTATIPPGSRCDITVDVAAEVGVTGTGRLSYQWVRGDGETSAVLTHTVWPGQHTARVHLYWEFSGTGHYDGTVTLKVLHPAAATGHGAFTYECP